MNKTYIHYGNDIFMPELIHGPHNMNPGWNKPKHALWASPVDADYGWIEWCIDNEYGTCEKDPSFKFRLKSNANVLLIDSLEKERLLPIDRYKIEPFLHGLIKPYDFDMLKENGYDAIEVDISGCRELYMKMYGWDCDSIAVLNPDVVEVIENDSKD